MAVTLEGRVADVTTRPVEDVTDVVVKAVTPTPSKSGLIDTQPARVVLGDDGQIKVTVEVGVRSVLYLDGDGWSDSIPLIAADGMTQLWEAIINAIPYPKDLSGLLDLKGGFEETARSIIAKLTKEHPYDKFWRGGIALDTNIDALLNAESVGAWSVASPTHAKSHGLPIEEKGLLFVVTTDIEETYQVFFSMRGKTAFRLKSRLGNVSPWYTSDPQWYRGDIARGTDPELLWSEDYNGTWSVINVPIAEELGLPSASGMLMLHNGSASNFNQHVFITLRGKVFTRRRLSNGNIIGWFPDEDEGQETAAVSTGVSGGSVAAYDTMLRGRGRIGTGGRPVLAFRFDHSAKPFIEKVKPILDKYGLPATLACFVNMMNPQPGYNSDVSHGYTWQDVQTCFHTGVEVFSHSWSHQDATTEAGIRHEIYDSRLELEKQMPDLFVHGWANPGIGNAYNGYWGGASSHHLEMGFDPAGALIANTYACFNTNIAGVTQLGTRNLAHRTIEKITSLDTVKNRVRAAADTTTAAVLMLHPNQLDADGRMSTDLFEEVCAWIAAERDAGRLEVLTMSGVALADPSTDYRHNLAPALPQWSKSGDTYSVKVPLHFASFARGSTRQLRVVPSQDGQVVMRVSAVGDSTMDVSRTVQATAGVPVLMPVGVPRTATDLEITVTGATVEDIRLESV